MKRVIRIAIVLVALVIIGVIILVLNLGRVVQAGVETGGQVVLDVPTELEGASVSIFGGSAGLDGLTLGSPEGYDAEHIFKLAHAHASVNVMSILSDEVVVREVVIDGPEITMEWSKGKLNWSALTEKLEKEPTEEEAKEEKEKASKKVRIGRIAFTNGKVTVKGLPLDVPVPLPNLEIKDIGTADGAGVTIRQLLAQIVGGLTKGLVDLVGKGLDPRELVKLPDVGLSGLEALGGGIADLGLEAGGTVVDGAAGAVEGAGEAAGSAVKGIGDAVGSLLGKKKDDDAQ